MTVLAQRAARLWGRLVELGVPVEAAPEMAIELVRDGWVCFGVDRATSTSTSMLPCPCGCTGCGGRVAAVFGCRHPGRDCAEVAG